MKMSNSSADLVYTTSNRFLAAYFLTQGADLLGTQLNERGLVKFRFPKPSIQGMETQFYENATVGVLDFRQSFERIHEAMLQAKPRR